MTSVNDISVSNIPLSLAFATLAALVSALAALPLLNRLAVGCGWVDAPDERKAHVGVIPLTGGATIAIAVIIALHAVLALQSGLAKPVLTLAGIPLLPWPNEASGLLAGLALCFLVGFWDDRYPLRARYRLIAQLSAAGCAILGGAILTAVGTTFTPFPLGLSYFAIPVTLLGLVGVANAYNMSDGLDGLCGGYAAVALAAFAICAGLITHQQGGELALAEIGPVILPFLGALLGFLVYNFRHPWRSRAASFLGDAGSMSLGFLIGWIAVRLASGFGPHSLPPVTALWIVALPLIDMFSCMIRRPLEGRTPMSADRRHIHHLLMALGLSVRQAVSTLVGLAALFAAIGIVGWQAGVAEYWLFWSLVALFAVYTAGSIDFWRRRGTPRAAHDAAASMVTESSGFSA